MKEENQDEYKVEIREKLKVNHMKLEWETCRSKGGRMGEMGEDGWNAGAGGCRGELTAAGEKCRGEVQAAGPWAAACRTDHVTAGQRGHCRGEAAGPWGSCRAEMVAGPRSHAMVESGLEPSDAYEDGVEFTEVSAFYLLSQPVGKGRSWPRDNKAIVPLVDRGVNILSCRLVLKDCKALSIV